MPQGGQHKARADWHRKGTHAGGRCKRGPTGRPQTRLHSASQPLHRQHFYARHVGQPQQSLESVRRKLHRVCRRVDALEVQRLKAEGAARRVATHLRGTKRRNATP